MIHALLKTVHLLAVVIWIGGMFFAHVCLRPALAALDPPVRLRLMHAVLGRFLAVVLWVVLLVLVSGLWMVAQATADATFRMPLGWTVMAALGLLMMAIFGHIRWVLFKRFDRAVATQDWPAGGAALGKIRQAVLLNLFIGAVIIVVLGLSGA